MEMEMRPHILQYMVSYRTEGQAQTYFISIYLNVSEHKLR